MSIGEFLFIMYIEYGKAPELVERYIPNNIADYSTIDREGLAMRIEADN